MHESNPRAFRRIIYYSLAVLAGLPFSSSALAQLSLSPFTQPASAPAYPSTAPGTTLDEQIAEAATLADQGKLDQARTQLSKLAKDNPRSGNVWLALGRIYEAANNSNAAMESYTKAVQLEPEKAETNLAVGSLYVRRNLPRLALRFLVKATQLAPNSAPACAALGLALAQMQSEADRKQALEMFANAVRLAPGEPDYRFKLGLFLVADGNVSIGVDNLHRALAQSMDQLRTAPLDYRISAQVEQFLASLLEIYQQQAAKAKGDEQAKYCLLISEALKKRAELYYHRTLNEQRVWALQAVRANPQNVDALVEYTRISLALGLDSEVREAVGRLVGLAPSDPRTLAIQKELAGWPASQPAAGSAADGLPASAPPASAPGSQPH